MGLAVGLAVALTVGLTVGLAVGLSVGLTEGLLVTLPAFVGEGTAVGLTLAVNAEDGKVKN